MVISKNWNRFYRDDVECPAAQVGVRGRKNCSCSLPLVSVWMVIVLVSRCDIDYREGVDTPLPIEGVSYFDIKMTTLTFCIVLFQLMQKWSKTSWPVEHVRNRSPLQTSASSSSTRSSHATRRTTLWVMSPLNMTLTRTVMTVAGVAGEVQCSLSASTRAVPVSQPQSRGRARAPCPRLPRLRPLLVVCWTPMRG